MRTLRDRDGTEWQVWRVTPDPRGFWERRKADRRRHQSANHAGEERRINPDRRSGASLSDGWLCFQSGSEKRRLMPVPPDWDGCAEDKLALLLRAATPVQSRSMY